MLRQLSNGIVQALSDILTHSFTVVATVALAPKLVQLPLQRFVVQDTSMQPVLRPGDRVLIARWLRARPGDVIVFRDPEAHARFMIKRVVSVGADGAVVVRGENPNVSRDSRHLGPVPRGLILGRAVYRYLPTERRGRL
jgi:nickel-type superoxide dismutase maturation protease